MDMEGDKDVLADVQFTACQPARYFDDFYVVDVTDSVETQANSRARSLSSIVV
ncbi:hypothetical protein [Klebsiella pneumoniae]|uniref:hypothetical protein n=1 Tax=Klebsiella pneumoniae TaxID=573 RepID=UPI00187B1A9E|nr:hypothetical protein [Klebsiella pneumoniae]